MTDLVLLAIAAGVIVDIFLAAYVFLHLKRRYVRAAFVVLALDAAIAAAAFVALDPGVAALGPQWNVVGLWTFGLSHPLVALYVLISIHGAAALRRYPYVLALFAPVPFFAILGPPQGVTAAVAYQTNWLSSYLVICLALALAEAIAWWRATELHTAEAFGLVLASTVAIIAGPAYSFELQFLNATAGQGANPGMPIVLALFAFVALRANALPLPTPAASTAAGGRFPSGRIAVLDEPRPKYASHFADRASTAGQPTVVFGRGPTRGGLALEAPTTQHGPARVAATVREFASRYPGGLVVLRNLGDVSAAAGPDAAVELVAEARALARAGRIGLVVSLWGLSEAERAAMRSRIGAATKMPRPEEEILAILSRVLGTAAGRILEGYAAGKGVRTIDLTPADVPAVVDHFRLTLRELARVLDDEPVVLGWRKEVDRLGLELDRFSRLSLEELSNGPWPSSALKATQEPYLVLSADYWKGRSIEEVLQAAEARTTSLQLGERVRRLFLESLGPAGAHLFEMELRRLRKSIRDLSVADIRAIAEGTEQSAGDLASAIDVASGRSELEARARHLRERLLELTGGSS